MINKQYGNTDNFHDNSSLAVAECVIRDQYNEHFQVSQEFHTQYKFSGKTTGRITCHGLIMRKM